VDTPESLAAAAEAAEAAEAEAALAEETRIAEEAAAAAAAGGGTTPPDGGGEEDTPEAFYAAVHAITGEEVTVDYGTPGTDGYVDPMSPEGLAMYTQEIRRDEVVKFTEHLKANDPRAYAYFLHRQDGGDDDSFMGERTVSLPTQADFDASIELQTSVYKRDLLSRGIDEDVADAQVAKAIKDNTLKTKADASYTGIKTAQANQLASMEEAANRDKVEFEQQCNTVIKSLDSALDSGAIKFIVPDTKKAGFKQYMKESLRHEDGKFYSVQEIGQDPSAAVEAMYFKYIKGDITSLVQKRAGTIAVQRMRLGVTAAKSGAVKGVQPAKARGNIVTLGEL
jgi:hypothetical protein